MKSAVLTKLQHFLSSAKATPAEAAWALRRFFQIAFAFQVTLACCAGLICALLLSPEPQQHSLMGGFLLATALAFFALAVLIAEVFVQPKTRAAALSAALFQGVLMGSSGLLALFAWLIGSSQAVVWQLLSLTLIQFILGSLLSSRHAKFALERYPEGKQGPPSDT